MISHACARRAARPPQPRGVQEQFSYAALIRADRAACLVYDQARTPP
jgi:hypothetical protein